MHAAVVERALALIDVSVGVTVSKIQAFSSTLRFVLIPRRSLPRSHKFPNRSSALQRSHWIRRPLLQRGGGGST